MFIKTASGKEFNLDFEPILTLATDPANYTQCIIDQINSGHYHLQECDVVIDAGANIGLFSIYASTMAKKVYAIEPTPEHYNNLCEIIKHLGITNIVPIHAALWDKSSIARFQLYNGGNTTMNNINPNGEIMVAALTVKDLVDGLQVEKIDYFKCDIEGGEHSLDFSTVSKKIENLFIEVHDNGPGLNQSTNNMQFKLQRLWNKTTRLCQDAILFSNL